MDRGSCSASGSKSKGRREEKDNTLVCSNCGKQDMMQRGVLKLLDIQIGGVIAHELKQEAMNQDKNTWTKGK